MSMVSQTRAVSVSPALVCLLLWFSLKLYFLTNVSSACERQRKSDRNPKPTGATVLLSKPPADSGVSVEVDETTSKAQKQRLPPVTGSFCHKVCTDVTIKYVLSSPY